MTIKPALHISPEEIDTVICFCERILTVLRLEHYQIYVSHKPAPGKTLASIKTSPGRYTGGLRLPKDWETKPIEERRLTLIHECLHLAHAGLSDAIKTGLEISGLEDSYQTLVWNNYMMAIEYMVDSLAIVLDNGFDLPWPTRAEVRRWLTTHVRLTS